MSISFHYYTCLSSIFSISFQNFLLYFPHLIAIRRAFLPCFPYHFIIQLSFVSWVLSILFHISTWVSSIFFISFHYFLMYFPNFPYHFTFQLTFFPYFPAIYPFPAILYSLSVSYNLIIFYVLALSPFICPFPTILFS